MLDSGEGAGLPGAVEELEVLYPPLLKHEGLISRGDEPGLKEEDDQNVVVTRLSGGVTARPTNETGMGIPFLPHLKADPLSENAVQHDRPRARNAAGRLPAEPLPPGSVDIRLQALLLAEVFEERKAMSEGGMPLKESVGGSARITKVSERRLTSADVRPRHDTVMMQRREIFFCEGAGLGNGQVLKIWVHRTPAADKLAQALQVRWSTADGVGSAIADRHYKKADGVVKFAPGQTIESFDIIVFDDDTWEPIRDFVVILREVVSGNGVIGEMDRTIVHVADDDVYPAKVPRDMRKQKRSAKEILVQSSNQSDCFLTADEMGDWVLIKSFIKERWTVMWPRPFYCSIAAMYKGSTGVITTYLTVRLVDAVFYPWEKDSEESAESISNSLAIAGGIAAGLVCTTLLSVFADYFIVRNRGTSTTRSSLRNWIVSQLLWADDERLSMTKMSLYLNAATNEVQEVSNCWQGIFRFLEALSSLAFTLGFTFVINFYAGLVLFFLCFLMVVLQALRGDRLRHLYVKRQGLERSFIATTAEIIDSIAAIRGMGSQMHMKSMLESNIREFELSHVQSRDQAMCTDHIAQAVTALTIGAVIMLAAWLVRTHAISQGEGVGIVTMFMTAGKSLVLAFGVVTSMRRSAERLRSVARILNYPTDAHVLAAQVDHTLTAPHLGRQDTLGSARAVGANESSSTKLFSSESRTASTRADYSRTHIRLDRLKHMSGSKKALNTAKRETRLLQSQTTISLGPSFSDNQDLGSGGSTEGPSNNGTGGSKMLPLHDFASNVRSAAMLGWGSGGSSDGSNVNGTGGSKKLSLRDVAKNVKAAMKAASFIARRRQPSILDLPGQPEGTLEEEVLHLSTDIQLGQIVAIETVNDEKAEAILQVLSGTVSVPQTHRLHVIPHLVYLYQTNVPTLFEGSIMRNLLMAVNPLRAGRKPAESEAWRVAEKCGLGTEFIDAPDNFSVGKAGRNLSASDRQVVSLARMILADPDVILLHQPTTLLTNDAATKVRHILREYVDKGGLWGILGTAEEESAMILNSTVEHDNVCPFAPEQAWGNDHGMPKNVPVRTVVFTLGHGERQAAIGIVDNIIEV